MHIIQSIHSFRIKIDLNEKFVFLHRIFNYYRAFIQQKISPYFFSALQFPRCFRPSLPSTV